MGTLAGGDENGKSNQNEPGLGRDSDTAMTDGDHASRWRFHTGVSEILLPLPELRLLTAQEEAERVSKRIRAEEAEAKQAQQPAAREPEKPAENPTANTRHRKLMRLAITVKSSRTRAAELLQSLELGRGLIFMPELHGCQRTRFADVEADARLQEAVEAGRCGRWLVEDGIKWKADISTLRRRYSERDGQSSRPPPSAANGAPAAGRWGAGASQRLFPNKADEMQSTMAEMSKMLQQLTETMMNLQQKNQPPEATSTPAAAPAEVEQLRKELAATKENAQAAAHTAACKLRRQEEELLELRRLLQLANTEITVVQNRLERLERSPPTRHATSSAKKAVHPRYGARPTPEKSPVFAPTTPGQPLTATPTGTGTGQPLQTPGMPFQFGPTPQVPATEQPATPEQMPLATVPEAATLAATPEALSVMTQLATPPHPEGQSSTKRQASPGTVLSPLRPYQLFKESTVAHSGKTYDLSWVDDCSDASDTDQFFDGSDTDQ